MKREKLAAFCTILLLGASAASAQQRPLSTQDPETIGAGRILIEGGVDYGRDVFYPLSGLKGNLWRTPTIGLVFGLSSIAEVQLTGGPYNHLAITDRLDAPVSSQLNVHGETARAVEDIVFATKIRVVSENESRPAIGLRFATRLPNASTESGLGTDTMDFYVSVLGAKTVRSLRVVANVGLGILGDPIYGGQQADVLAYGLSLARALTTRIEVVGELNGRFNRAVIVSPGNESRSIMRLGARYTRGPVRFDASTLLGMTSSDPAIGFGLGVTYIFNAFKVQ
jgi:hypothetical protein